MNENDSLSSQEAAGRHQINTLVATAKSRRNADQDRARTAAVSGLVEEIKRAIAQDRRFVRETFPTSDDARLFADAAQQAGHRARCVGRVVDIYWSDELPPPPIDERFATPGIIVDQAINL